LADDLYFLLGDDKQVFLVLRTHGQEFSVACGAVDKDGPSSNEWTLVAAAVASGLVPMSDLDRIWKESRVRKQTIPLILALQGRGIPLPVAEAAKKAARESKN
jgi:hypothetical protein